MRFLGIAVLVVLVAVLLVIVGGSAFSASGEREVGAALSSYEEVPTLSTTGRGEFEAKISENMIDYELSYSGVQGGTVAAAHIHLGRTATTGGVIAFLCGGGGKPPCPATSGSVSGTIVPADIIGPAAQGIAPGEFNEAVRAILNGSTYVNVHTTPTYPGGEIRGQINDEDED